MDEKFDIRYTDWKSRSH